ncbi:MAG TPA: helix-turn-helix domain-containing protein [Candidatus Rubrimentiphilum sp.]|nr:helix-turn-helix domain-containing protein [Candidatus Rubrimentiphilum sp.]
MQVNIVEDLPPVAAIESLEALQVVADSQRHRVVTLLIEEALTARELAERLGIARTRLYYHLDLLEKHGLIRVTETRVVSGILERTYRAVARAFRVDRALLSARSSESEVNDAQASILDAVASDLRARPANGRAAENDVMVSRSFLRLNASRRRELCERLNALIREYDDSESSDGHEVEVALAIFPAQKMPS